MRKISQYTQFNCPVLIEREKLPHVIQERGGDDVEESGELVIYDAEE